MVYTKNIFDKLLVEQEPILYLIVNRVLVKMDALWLKYNS